MSSMCVGSAEELLAALQSVPSGWYPSMENMPGGQDYALWRVVLRRDREMITSYNVSLPAALRCAAGKALAKESAGSEIFA